MDKFSRSGRLIPRILIAVGLVIAASLLVALLR